MHVCSFLVGIVEKNVFDFTWIKIYCFHLIWICFLASCFRLCVLFLRWFQSYNFSICCRESTIPKSTQFSAIKKKKNKCITVLMVNLNTANSICQNSCRQSSWAVILSLTFLFRHNSHYMASLFFITFHSVCSSCKYVNETGKLFHWFGLRLSSVILSFLESKHRTLDSVIFF